MKILVLSSFAPPDSSLPGSPRLFCLVRELAHRHEFHLLFPSTPEDFAKWSGAVRLKSPFVSVDRLAMPPPATWLSSQKHRIRGAAHSVMRHRHPGYFLHTKSRVEERIHLVQPDLILLHGVDMIQYLDSNLGIPIVADLVDAMSLLFERSAEQLDAGIRRWRLKRERRGYAELEQTAARLATALVFVSEVDAEWVRHQTHCGTVRVVGNGVDTDYFSPKRESIVPHRIVFIGTMDYEPNIDAVKWFVHEVFPAIREEIPDAEFQIVGNSPTPDVTILAEVAGVEVTGEVPDVRPYFNQAAVLAVPLRFGVGVKNKVLQAMVMEIPLIATSTALDGINVCPHREVVIADTAELFAAKVVDTLRDPESAQKRAAAACARVHETCSWSAAARVLEATFPVLLKAQEQKQDTVEIQFSDALDVTRAVA